MDCIQALNAIATNRSITIHWIRSHSDSMGNQMADSLAKSGANSPAHGPEPFLGLKEKQCREICNSWVEKCVKERWRYTNSCSHTKEFISSPQANLTNKLLTLSKMEMSYTISIITGHIRLNDYLRKIGVRDDPDCDLCGRANENAIHFLCNCPSLGHIRRGIFNMNPLTPNEVMTSHIRSIFLFVKQSGRFPVLRNHQTISQNVEQGVGGAVLNTDQPLHQFAQE